MSESSNQQASRSPGPDGWRNRIVGSGGMRAGDFLANPHNWRIHPKNQQDGLAGVLDTVGWVQEVIVNQRTGFLVDGHLRVTLALRKGEDTAVPVKYVDLTEDEEALILAALDPLGSMAATDRAKLDEVMRMANSDNAAVQQMMAEIAEREGILGDLPTLDDLESEYGEHDERSFWPMIKVQVSPETLDRYKDLLNILPGSDEAEKFNALVFGYGLQ